MRNGPTARRHRLGGRRQPARCPACGRRALRGLRGHRPRRRGRRGRAAELRAGARRAGAGLDHAGHDGHRRVRVRAVAPVRVRQAGHLVADRDPQRRGGGARRWPPGPTTSSPSPTSSRSCARAFTPSCAPSACSPSSSNRRRASGTCWPRRPTPSSRSTSSREGHLRQRRGGDAVRGRRSGQLLGRSGRELLPGFNPEALPARGGGQHRAGRRHHRPAASWPPSSRRSAPPPASPPRSRCATSPRAGASRTGASTSTARWPTTCARR